MKWYQYFLYFFTLPWDIVGWLGVLLLRLFWGENLRWECAPENGSWCLTCDLRPDSWPCRTWYTYKVKVNGKKQKIANRPDVHSIYGPYRTWAGTTISPHAIFYGPGRRVEGKWWGTQHHEHIHSEQGEGVMVRGFFFALPVFIHSMIYDNNLWIMALLMWFLSYGSMFANYIVAWLRGEEGYRGSVHEEHAYDGTELEFKGK